MRFRNFLLWCAAAWSLVFTSPELAEAQEALVGSKGSDFQGGAKELYGSLFDGEPVNYIYAEPTGRYSKMQISFPLTTVPSGDLYLHLKARDDDGPSQCSILIELNGKTLFEGRNDFAPSKFEQHKFAIPDKTLVAGENTLVIASREKHGTLGMPPWFQVAGWAIAPAEYLIHRNLHEDFRVALPERKTAFPEPLAPGKSPGFKWRGMKGWMWKPEQYLAEIPVLSRYEGNFLMNCYSSMCDVEHYRWGDSQCNRWWEPFPPEKKRAYERVVRACQTNGIIFCFSMNPNLFSKRFVNDGSPDSIDQLFRHYEWMQNLGVKWFNVSLDDISNGINASSQAKVVNEMLRRLRKKDSKAQMIFCPTFYWGDGTSKEQRPYLETLARELDGDIYLFWTGDAVVGKITRKAAESFRSICDHRLFLWDNYPVNDNNPTMHLGPVIDRDPDVNEVVDGYVSNPMCRQNEANRIPLLTCLDYAWNPCAYDPMRSIGQAILQLAETQPQQEVLRQLVEAYPGMLLFGNGNTGFNSVQERFQEISSTRHSRIAAEAYVHSLEELFAQLRHQFPTHYQAEKETLENDIRKIKQRLAAKYGDSTQRHSLASSNEQQH